MKKPYLLIILATSLGLTTASIADWKPSEAPILTKWAKTVTPDNVWQDYPRPLLKRADWQNLNGLWDYAVQSKDEGAPQSFEGKILVPFSIESPLSGVGREVTESDAIWYQRQVEPPESWLEQRILVHFEASDFHTTVWLNGKKLGENKGGYKLFSFDITEAIHPSKTNTLLVKVIDPQHTIYKSLGKQANRSGQYQGCSGIWQTVWMEAVPKQSHIEELGIQSDMQGVTISTDTRGSAAKVRYELIENGSIIAEATVDADASARLAPGQPKLWSPESPFLYDLKATLLDANGNAIDTVTSYCGLREFSREDSSLGSQMTLNGEEIFQVGPLDQSYWPGGGLTPPSNEAMIWEAQYLKDVGCNMVRLHIKRNPRLFYEICDRIGLIVWQDYITPIKQRRNPSPEESAFWFEEQKDIVETLKNHPSIGMWIVFNEAWGQHDSERIYAESEKLDPSRWWSIASGWYDVPGLSDIRDLHDYTFRPAIPVLGTDKRSVILGEAGGHASAVPPHNWTGRSNTLEGTINPMFGGFDPSHPRDDDSAHDMFRPTFTYGEAFEKQYARFIDNLRLLKNQGLSAMVYTQMTDMKLEENGWLTFDREVSKMDIDVLKAMHETLYEAPPKQTVILKRSSETKQSWQVAQLELPKKPNKAKAPLTTLAIQAPFDSSDLDWATTQGPFGNLEGPNNWNGQTQLVARKNFDLQSVPESASVRIFTKLIGDSNEWMHTRIHINGHFVADEVTRQFMTELRVAEVLLPESAMKLLKPGQNEIMLQLFPGLVSRSGHITSPPEKVLVDVEITAVDWN